MTSSNQPSPTRRKYRQLTELDRAYVDLLKDHGDQFIAALDNVPAGTGVREIALAKTKIEEAVMWAVKGLTG